MRVRRGFVVTDADIQAPPASGHSWYQVAADLPMKLQDQVFAEGVVRESAVHDVGFEGQNAEGDAGRQLGMALNAERRFYETDGRVRRWSSASSIFWSTGFASNAMLRATLRGIRARRTRRCSLAGSLRHRATTCFQSMGAIIDLQAGINNLWIGGGVGRSGFVRLSWRRLGSALCSDLP
jgi:hypothetical protein